MRPLSQSSEAPAPAGAFLLPWQLLALGWLCGIWATRFPQPALLSAVLLALFCWLRQTKHAKAPYGTPAHSSGQLRKPFILPGRIHTCSGDTISGLTTRGLLTDTGFTGTGCSSEYHTPAAQRFPFLFPVLLCCSLLAGYGAASRLETLKEVRIPDFIENRKPVLVSGTVVAVEAAPDSRLHVILDNIRCQSAAPTDKYIRLMGRMVWTWDHPEPLPGQPDGVRIGPGQRVSLKQRIKPVRGFLNPGTWDSGQYWQDKDVQWRVWSRGSRFDLAVSGTPDRLWQLRERIRSQCLRLLESSAALLPESGNAAATIPALLFGDRFYLTYDRMDQLSLAAISHSLALSGMHLGVVAGLGWALAWLLGWCAPSLYLHIPRPKLAVLLATPLVAVYVWLGGASPSLIRSALMFACWGILLWRNRPRVLLDGVFIAVTLITLHTPLALFDLRLQLSALAVLSLALFLPWIEHLLQRFSSPESLSAHTKLSLPARITNKTRRAATSLLAANICIQLGMMPVVIWNFNTSSLWFPLNLLWLPILGLWILPACLAGLTLCLLAGALPSGVITGLPPLAQLLADLARGCFTAATAPVAALFTGLDWIQQQGWLLPNLALRPHWLEITGYWCVLVASALLFAKRRALATLTMALGASLLVWPLAVRMIQGTDNTITLTMLDVGQGQSLLITLPQNHRILIDGGGFGITGFDTGKSIVTPVLTWRMPPQLDLIVNTHPDTDHLQGLFYPLRHAAVSRYADNGRPGSRDNEALLKQTLEDAAIQQETTSKGMILYQQENITLEVLHPAADMGHASSNNAALALRLVHTSNNHKHGLALIMGDLEKQGLRALLKSGSDITADVLVLPHHGSRSSFEPKLYDAVHPRIAFSATGYLNQWNFPSVDVKEALTSRSIPLYDTALNGQVQATWLLDSHNIEGVSAAGPKISVMQK